VVNQVIGVPPRPECVGDARQTVARAAQVVGLDQEKAEDLLIAVSEAVTNAVEAHIAAGIEEPLELGCHFDGNRLEVSVEDRGDGFDVDLMTARPPLSSDEHLVFERGWGIQLMHTLVDDVSFRSTGRGTAVRLSVEVDRPGPGLSRRAR
jgi:serine/threonine-protein kinase RsbW